MQCGELRRLIAHNTFSFLAVGSATNTHESLRADTLQHFTSDLFLAFRGVCRCGVRHTITQQFATWGATELLLCKLRRLLEARYPP